MNTHFITPHGLHDPNHYTTARDLARMAQVALENPQFRELVATPVIELPWAGKPWKRVIYNKNKFLQLFAGADGVKTGYTTPAGRCLVASATRDDWQLIAVVLRCNNAWQDAAGLLTYGFNQFHLAPIVEKGEAVSGAHVQDGDTTTCRAVTADEVVVPYPKNHQPQVERRITLKRLQAPVRKGQRVGTLAVSVDGQTVGRVPLVTATSVPLSLIARMSPWVKAGGWGTLGLLIGVWGYGAAAKTHRARRRRITALRRAVD